MNMYTYNVEDGQFSFQFDAPLLGKKNDTISIYDNDPITNEPQEIVKITIHEINHEDKRIECTGNTE